MNANNDEGKLISGDEAKKAWDDGKKIEVSYKEHQQENCWFLILDSDKLSVFDRKDVLFRLAPRTITINGIEVPAPFEPQAGEEYYYINSGREGGYAMKLHDGKRLDVMAVQFGAWRTEEEVKQVVAALRQVFGGAV